ncbi:hypothetical protein FRC07_012821 [Ceratobasidium sp. 392]|nr:hypothetical protein FRC07_012821 [Ceratobasidium sp. 392]
MQNLGIEAHFEFTQSLDPKTKQASGPVFVKIHVLKGLKNDPSLGPSYAYHIHTNPVPADGNCTKTLAHHDPLSVTEGFVCNPAFPQYCQTSDLAGKHGKLNGTTTGEIATFGYSDPYLRFYPATHSLLGRSIVIHSSNKTRLACANITSYLDGTADYSFEPTHKPSKYVKDYPKAAPVQPTPAIIWSNGTTPVDPAVFATFPYLFPIAALDIYEAPSVKLGNITHKVKFNNTEQTVTQPKETKVGIPIPYMPTFSF